MATSKEKLSSRRRFLIQLTGITTGLTIASSNRVKAASVPKATQSGRVKRTLRFAHICDIHIQTELGAAEGTAAMFKHAQGLDDKPELFITGGDNIMDSFGANVERTKQQWALLKEIIEKECRLPIKYCIGNHDVWGWDKEKSITTGAEPLWGKKWVMQALDLPNRYYSFDKGKWHFIILDSTFPAKDKDSGYIGKLDEKQFIWLKNDIETANPHTPIVIISHIPIISVAGIELQEPQNYQISISGSAIHYDAPRIIRLLKQYSNVKLCLSGHIHRCDRIEYCGTTYICDGAVSGAWWKGDNRECDEGYGIVDLYEDGSFQHQYIAYNWQPKTPKELPAKGTRL